MKKLLIVESPAKIKTISKFLGKDFKIMSTIGHIKDLPKKKIGVSMNDTIDIEYVVLDGKKETIESIKKAAKGADAIYLAPDPDREGEIIAWHVEQEIKGIVSPDKIHRITFNEITKPAITEAIENPYDVDLHKVSAQQARRVLDRWVGYEVSPVLWRKIKAGLSAGRVQSVALKLICDRELDIRAFKPTEYWSIDGLFSNKAGELTAALTHINKKKAEINNEKEAKEIVEKVKKADFVVESITDKKRVKNPSAPFMTSTLQQAAYNQLGFNVKKTMEMAQKLYEGVSLGDPQTPVALITYMRTDSVRIADTALNHVRKYINSAYGKDYLPPKAFVYSKAKKGQDAHEAIRPIDVAVTPEYAAKFLPPPMAKVYALIWQRFVACQMNPAQYAQRQVVLQGNTFTFKATGSTLIFDGFLAVYGYEEEDEKEKKVKVPKDLKANQAIDLKKTFPKQHFTQPLPRFTEASLVKELEKEGIGRPSTYATILNTIRARDYTTLEDRKRFVPTELGLTVTKMLEKNLPKIMNVKFTAHLEEDLDKIANGQMKRDELLREFYKEFEKDLKEFIGSDGKRSVEPTDITCPDCNKNKLAIRFGKSGPFLGCMGYPDCSFTSNFKRIEDGTIELVKPEKPKILEETCPNCGKPLRQIMGKFGPFVACTGYPECKYIHQEKAGFPCPLDKGEIVKKVWRGGTMWGCKNYPACKFAIFGDIEETPCPLCKSPFLIKKINKAGDVTLACNTKGCGYKK